MKKMIQAFMEVVSAIKKEIEIYRIIRIAARYRRA